VVQKVVIAQECPFAESSLTIDTTTITANLADGGPGAVAGQGIGGGLYNNGGRVTLTKKVKIFGNTASTSNPNTFGL